MIDDYGYDGKYMNGIIDIYLDTQAYLIIECYANYKDHSGPECILGGLPQMSSQYFFNGLSKVNLT